MQKLISLCFRLPIVVAFILTGCGGVTANQPVFTPVQPDPTSTPTIPSAGSVPVSTPTSVVSDQVTTSNYTHSTNRFSINYPENWQFFERSDGVVFIEPGDQAGYSLVFNDVGEEYSEEELNRYLVTFVAQNFVDEKSGFSPISQEQRADGSIIAQFASIDPHLGPAINEVRVWQQDTIVFLLFISATEEQWHISHHKLQNLADTFVSLDTSPIVESPPTDEPPVWLLIGPTKNQFGFFYPSDWEILQQDETLVVVAMPDHDITFEGSVYDWPEAKDNPVGAAEQAALAYLETLSKEHRNVQNQPLTEFPLDTATGATIDFLYTTKEGTDMAGSVITAASKGKIYQMVFTSPAAIYESALQWFNPMYKSFKILSPEGLILEDEVK